MMVISIKRIGARFVTSPFNFFIPIYRPYATVITEPFGWAKNQQLNHGPSASSCFSTHHSQAAQVDKEIIEKYQDKLKKKAQEFGKSSIEELLEAQLSRSKSVEQVNQANGIQGSPKIVPPKVTDNPSKATLSSFLKIDKIVTESSETIAQIWKTYHEDKSCLSATIPGETYRALTKKFREFPQFLIPLPRGEAGHEFYFMQAHFHQIYFTSLGEYKLHGAQARPHLIITHYPELLSTKNIILMRGELGSFEGCQIPISLEDAKLLVLRLQQFYLTESPAKKALVNIFNKNPTEFDHLSLLEEADKLD